MKEKTRAIIMAAGKKIDIPNCSKIIIAAKDDNNKHHQASVDINVPNINRLLSLIKN